MKWIIDKSKPTCPQIYEHICVLIANGFFPPKSKLYSIRELALQIGVNPNIVQKSFIKLEESKIVYSIPESGWYVSENIENAKKVGILLRDTKIQTFFNEMNNLGYSTEEIITYIKERYGDKNV